MSDASSLLAHWRLQFAEVDYQTTYRPRLKHQATDGLLRILTDSTVQTTSDDGIPTIREESKKEDNDLEERDLVGVVTVSQGKDREPEVMKCTIDSENHPLEEHVAKTDGEDLNIIKFAEPLEAQQKDHQCGQSSIKVGTSRSIFDCDCHEIQCRRS